MANWILTHHGFKLGTYPTQDAAYRALAAMVDARTLKNMHANGYTIRKES